MADSFLDTAGGLQQVPTVDVVEKLEQPYAATDGSMQSALAVNVLSGGIPANGVAVTDGESVDILSADGSTQLATGTADIETSGNPNVLNGIDLPANYAVIQDGDDNHILNNNDDSAGGAMQINVAANVPSFKLFNAVQRVATHMAPITIVAANAKTAGASFAIDQGVFQNFPLGNATDTILSNGDAIEIENQGDTQSVGGTVTVAAGVAIARLPANSALVGNNVAMTVPVTGTYVDTITPQVNAAGVITGFTLS